MRVGGSPKRAAELRQVTIKCTTIIIPTKAVKYLKLMMDNQNMFGKHVHWATKKADEYGK